MKNFLIKNGNLTRFASLVCSCVGLLILFLTIKYATTKIELIIGITIGFFFGYFGGFSAQARVFGLKPFKSNESKGSKARRGD